jgi:hypothetical protein
VEVKTATTKTSALSQPTALPRTSPQTMPKAPPVTSVNPGTSMAALGPRLSSIRVMANGIRTSAHGTLSQKIHGHEMPSTTAPPKSGPRGTARRRVPRATIRRRKPARRPPTPPRNPQAGHEHAAASETVAQRCSGHEQHRKAQDVRVDGPLELLDRRAEVHPNRGQGGRDHQRVEHHHQRGRGRQRERPSTCRCRAASPDAGRHRGASPAERRACSLVAAIFSSSRPSHGSVPAAYSSWRRHHSYARVRG